MTVTVQAPETTWQTRPGWGIAVGLTPREVVVARQVRVHQRLIALALVLVLAMCVGFALLTRADRASAQREYEQEQGRTPQLAAEAAKYAPITTMERVTAQVNANLATVMSQDVDIAGFMAHVDRILPSGVTVDTESVLLTAATPAAAPPGDPATATDPTQVTPAGPTPATGAAAQVIGTVSLAGSGPWISTVSRLVAALSAVPGVVDVVPTSVTQGDTGAAYSITLNLTDDLYTGRYAQAGTS